MTDVPQTSTTPSAVGSAPALQPSTEERLLAAAAHLTLFMGFWIVGPLVIYFWQKERSRFVAFHAVQATLTAVLMLLVGTTIGVVYVVGMIASALLMGQTREHGLMGLVLLAFTVLVLVIAVLPTLWAIYAAWKAYHGEAWRVPIVGAVTARLVPELPERWVRSHG